jgi:2,4-dienoyl-CoA reductase-like NADH-dependent reductase (Old Yellow Enzyme family)
MGAPPIDHPSFATPLDLPCGARIKNRFLKSAMSEQLGDVRHDATPGLATLYRTWAEGGVGLQVTGNVMVDRTALGEPLNVALDDASDRGALARWAEAGRSGGAHCWVQLNHPGRQSPAFLSPHPVAPSAVPLAGSLRAAFRTPRALTGEEIRAVVERFAHAAALAKDAGFTGVQIHGAHGYLVSQFLSPRVNQRADGWGGSPEKRRRFVLEVYCAIRARVGPRFPVGIKLNSADFQSGGFDEAESM